MTLTKDSPFPPLPPFLLQMDRIKLPELEMLLFRWPQTDILAVKVDFVGWVLVIHPPLMPPMVLSLQRGGVRIIRDLASVERLLSRLDVSSWAVRPLLALVPVQ